MTRPVRTVAAAALALTALAASPARADRGCDRRPPPVAYVPAPVRVVVPVPVERTDWRRHELREEWRRLERARDRFYATWNGNPWEQRRFERWYAERRAELGRGWRIADRRWDRRDDHDRGRRGWEHDRHDD
jgi:hypothetical protein